MYASRYSLWRVETESHILTDHVMVLP